MKWKNAAEELPPGRYKTCAYFKGKVYDVSYHPETLRWSTFGEGWFYIYPHEYIRLVWLDESETPSQEVVDALREFIRLMDDGGDGLGGLYFKARSILSKIDKS